MQFRKGQEIDCNEFLSIVDKCKGEVLLISNNGDTFNLKSLFSRFLGMSELIKEHGMELELFCYDKTDESKFLEYFHNHPETI